MPRLSRAKKRDHERAAAAAPVAAPIDVHVPAAGPGGVASIGGVPVSAAPGEEIQHVVLTHLQRIALAAGRPVHATVHDERIGYVVPLLVEQDGSSRYTAEPVRTAPVAEPAIEEPIVRGSATSDPTPGATPYRDTATHVLRPLPGPAQDASPTFRLRPLPGPGQDAVPGTVAPPLGEFGPPPRMDAGPEPTEVPRDAVPQTAVPRTAVPQTAVPRTAVPETAAPQDVVPQPSRDPIPLSDPAPLPVSAPARSAVPVPDPGPEPEIDPDAQPAPPRGFDAVAEAMFGDMAPATADASPFAERSARINDAVKEGRTAEAAELAERTVAEASAVLGPEHPEVLRIRELSAYIAYLAGDPERAFALALDVARRHHRARAAEAAYGSLHGAATAWRAVRDPALGLHLGRELLGLWAELTAEGGPAADDVEELESARARMDRLTARAAKSAEPPTG
ncbi:tetratricopeptide repeat protein [Streptomyces sp. NPDC098781]|uniref:tetratricopeptide repeat protein n=1 Tax=Streptomyces sp. NPDC098781 TaxID=3366097 RepID=UPI00380BDA6C